MKSRALIHLVLSVALFAGLVSVYGFWYQVVASQSAEAAKLATAIEEKSIASARVASAKTALKELEDDESSVRAYLVETTDVVPFLETLEATGRQLGATVTVASVSADDSSAHPHLNLSLKITGSFDAVLRTLGAIEYGPYDSELSNMTFDTPRPDAATGPSVWTAAATFVIGTRTSI